MEEKKETALAVQQESQPSVLSIIAQLAQQPDFDASKMESLISMQERINANEARISFNKAMAIMQPQLPTIHKKSKGHNSQYAKYEDIDKAVRPFYTDAGFSISYTSKQNGAATTYYGTLSHKDGHSITSELQLPADTGGSKNAVQAIGSTMSYAKRYLICALLNIVTTDEDDDGQAAAGNGTIDEDQISEILTLIEKTGSDKDKFLAWLSVPGVEDIRIKDYDRAISQLKRKAAK